MKILEIWTASGQPCWSSLVTLSKHLSKNNGSFVYFKCRNLSFRKSCFYSC